MKISIKIFVVSIPMCLLSCNGSDSNTEINALDSTQQNNSAMTDADYLALGDSISASAQVVIKQNLLDALGNGGPLNAIEFCNTKAISLTDSMAIVLNTSIKRVSDQSRNPLNAADSEELNYIKNQKEKLLNGENVLAEVHESNGKMIGYYPILTNALCLQCHGKKDETMTSETFKKIQELYPSDLATGYDLNELRGIWVVTMDKK
ncbi:MAG: DUF3365 domain-containing protein [Crocinitomicaceae bacterium]|jgi:hypothetical protein|nr:DUF3365 domain-containing protein [Crocinitomicaceae bacterium]MBK6953091.1 DUF3365 domain-containing protein [Crocinitomicaceae bacterium]